MKSLLIAICILTFSCTNNDSRISSTKATTVDSIFLAEGFETTVAYSDPVCLQYKGKPLLTIGQNVKQLDTAFSFRYDPNGKYQDHFQSITDYLSLDNYFSADLTTGENIGAIYFSTDKEGRIFRLAGNWTINTKLVDTTGTETVKVLQKKYFPCLPPDFKGRRTFESTHKNYIEKFHLYPSSDSADINHGNVPQWSLDYSIVLTKKNGL